jgi:hypothetical protein
MIIEYLVKLCIEDFTRFVTTLQTEKATIFSTSAMFDSTGSIEFNPNGDMVKNTVMEIMKDTVTLMNSLPRVMYHVSIPS